MHAINELHFFLGMHNNKYILLRKRDKRGGDEQEKAQKNLNEVWEGSSLQQQLDTCKIPLHTRERKRVVVERERDR
jgi:hypothetical protein